MINQSLPLKVNVSSAFPSCPSLSPYSVVTVLTASTKVTSKPAHKHETQEVDSSSSSDSENSAGDELAGSDEDLPNMSSLTDEQLADLLGSEVNVLLFFDPYQCIA